MKMSKKIFRLFSKYTVGMFYNRKYLCGKWFDDSIKGWRWCWKDFFMQKIIGYNRHISFPVSHRNNIGDERNLIFSPNDMNNFQNFGCYYQCGNGRIVIGEGTWIAPNVGIITENHDIYNLEKHQPAKDVIIGEKSWIGMNTIILPGVVLGDRTIVGGGTVVTKSFPKGNCIIAGNPARIIRELSVNEEINAEGAT